MGDFNIHLLHYNSHSHASQFLDNLFSFMLCPLISKPTRLTSHSATLIDNIFTNNLTHNSTSGLLINDLSELSTPVFDDIAPPCTKDFKKQVRDFSDKNVIKFKSFIKDYNWQEVFESDDPNEAYNNFIDKFMHIYNSCFPLKNLKGKALKTAMNPWMSKGILNSIRRKNNMYKKLLNNFDPNFESNYKTYKNKLNHLIQIAKKNYYATKLDSEKNKKGTWKVINEIITIKI